MAMANIPTAKQRIALLEAFGQALSGEPNKPYLGYTGKEPEALTARGLFIPHDDIEKFELGLDNRLWADKSANVITTLLDDVFAKGMNLKRNDNAVGTGVPERGEFRINPLSMSYNPLGADVAGYTNVAVVLNERDSKQEEFKAKLRGVVGDLLSEELRNLPKTAAVGTATPSEPLAPAQAL